MSDECLENNQSLKMEHNEFSDPSFLTVIISKLKPDCISQIDHEIENAILSILS